MNPTRPNSAHSCGRRCVRPPGHRRRRPGDGFSLSELTLSLGIIGAATVTILALMGTSLSQGGSARLSQEAHLAARQVFSELQLRSDALRRGEAQPTLAALEQRQWLFGPGLEPLAEADASEALYLVTVEFPPPPAASPQSGNQAAPAMAPLQPVELRVRHPWRGQQTDDQRVDRMVTALRWDPDS